MNPKGRAKTSTPPGGLGQGEWAGEVKEEVGVEEVGVVAKRGEPESRGLQGRASPGSQEARGTEEEGEEEEEK